jgi:hypothetical protein
VLVAIDLLGLLLHGLVIGFLGKLVVRLVGKLVLRLFGKLVLRLVGKLVHFLRRLLSLACSATRPSFSHVDQLLLRRERDLEGVSAGVERRRPTAWPSTWATS